MPLRFTGKQWPFLLVRSCEQIWPEGPADHLRPCSWIRFGLSECQVWEPRLQRSLYWTLLLLSGSTPKPWDSTERKPSRWEICSGSSTSWTASYRTDRTDTKCCAGKKPNKRSSQKSNHNSPSSNWPFLDLRSLSVRCKLYFNNFLIKIKCGGSMDFDHNNELLSISVSVFFLNFTFFK